MFTGIVLAKGTVSSIDRHGAGARLRIECAALEPGRWHEGDSIAVSGCCLTALAIDDGGFAADLSPETLACTSLGGLAVGDAVNLEPALAAGDRLGGHLVSGHVDGLAEWIRATPSGDNRVVRLAVADALKRFIAPKGSVTLDGVSLTINRVEDAEFEVNLIPHTLAETTLGERRDGDHLNLEVDLVARYLDRLLEQRGHDAT